MEQLTLTRPDDWHQHLRDGDKLERTVADAARQFARVIVMPNLLPPVTTVATAQAYYERILAVCQVPDFKPLMTLYLTESTDTQTIREASRSGFIYASKLYPAGATTNAEAGVRDLTALYPIFAEMETVGMPLLIHGEVTTGDIFDREARFIETMLIPLIKQFPKLRIVLEHITTQTAVEFIREQSNNVAATITPHHLLCNRNDLLVGGLKPDYYCLPILKADSDQQALIKAATSGDTHFFLGSDSAPHSRANKYCASGCAGVYNGFATIELYAMAFAQANALHRLEAFASFHGADFYQLPRNQTQITLHRESWEMPAHLIFGKEMLTPFYAGKTLQWKLVCNDE